MSEEDLDLRNLTHEELIAYWNLWLHQAQATNDLDEAFYYHGASSSEIQRWRLSRRLPTIEVMLTENVLLALRKSPRKSRVMFRSRQQAA